METFEVTVRGEVLTIKPMEDDTFQVYRDERMLATLTPTIDALGIEWTSTDLIAPEYAQAIGEAIESLEK